VNIKTLLIIPYLEIAIFFKIKLLRSDSLPLRSDSIQILIGSKSITINSLPILINSLPIIIDPESILIGSLPIIIDPESILIDSLLIFIDSLPIIIGLKSIRTILPVLKITVHSNNNHLLRGRGAFWLWPGEILTHLVGDDIQAGTISRFCLTAA
jgi:hypothetical protein